MSFENWDFSCPDWEVKLKAGKTPIPDLPLDMREAEAAVKYFDKLCIPDIKGQPKMQEAAGEWFRDIIRAAFGSVKNAATGERWIEEIFILVPKKNSKTTNSAALGLVAMLMNKTPNIEGVIIAPTIAVANTCFRQAVGMIKADEYLTRRFRVVEHMKEIIDMEADADTGQPRNAKLMIKAFDVKVVTGTIPAFAIIDELHVMAADKNADRVLGQITGGAITEQETFIIYITTQSETPPVGVFKEQLQYARGVRDGKYKEDVKTLAVIYEFSEAVQTDDEKPWRNPELWPMVLPNLGRSVKLEKLIPKFRQAEAKGAAELARWASQHLNIEIGLALHSERWIGADYWTSCADPVLTLDEILLRSEVVTVGFDGGGLDDLAGLAVIGRCSKTRRWLSWSKAWAHPDVFERRKQIETTLRDFEADGDLVVVPDNDPLKIFRDVTEIISKIHKTGLLPENEAVGLDSQAVADLVDMLLAAELTLGPGGHICAVAQGWQLSSAIWGIELKLKVKSLLHKGSRLMNWVLGNAKAELKGKNIYISKAAAGKAKIDPLTALFNAYQLMAKNPEAEMKNLDDFLSNPVMSI